MLIAKNVHKSFGEKKVLNGLDLMIKPGEITCAIGPSGTGKTTLLRALGCLDYPEQGSIEIDGLKHNFPLADSAEPPHPWPHMTVVFQSLFLWPHMTLRENIMLPARNCNPNAAKDIEGLIRIFDMEHFIDKFPNQASIGQRQRVALVRALLLNPKYILMDEITSALDVEQTAKILTKLTHLKERGIGIFIITHELGFARNAADHIVFLDDGRVAEDGGPDILKNPQTPRLKEFLQMASEIF